MTAPLIFYSIGSRVGGQGLSLVAQQAGEALTKHGMLEQLVCYGKTGDVHIDRINRIYFQPAKLFSHLPSKYYYSMKRLWIDWRASHYLKYSKASIFHGWTHESLKSIRLAKSKGMITILERGNPHPLYTKKTLELEYGAYGIQNNFLVNEKNPFMRKFNHWRYELNEALEEIELADYIFVNSDFCRQTFIDEGVSESKIKMIPRGFNPIKYSPREPQKVGDKFIVLFVGQLLLRKGIRYILEAWSQFNVPNSELWFVGTVTDEVKKIINFHVTSKTSIRFFGSVKDPSQYYQQASVFLFPSLDEGSAKVTYEAMACKLPCIFTHSSGAIANGENAIFVPIRSSDAILNALIKLYADVDLRNDLGQRAYDSIKRYTWSYYQESLLKTYHSLMT
jgi:glycosyltransferase involved in cell wall biosynthesis